MPDRFDKFVHEENIRNFKRQIEAEDDPVRLALLRRLLREEQMRTPVERPPLPS
jgi:hypothetical protein